MTEIAFRSPMQEALRLAGEAYKLEEVPVGAVVADPRGHILAGDHNRVNELRDPTAHAEILAIRKACRIIANERLVECSIYVTIEPCPMCASAISQARIARLYYGAMDEKSGGVDNGPKIFNDRSCHWKPEVYGGIMEMEARGLIRCFFSSKRTSG